MSPKINFLTAGGYPKNEKKISNELLDAIQHLKTIKSEMNLNKVKIKINEYCRYLSGSFTPQKYQGFDEDHDTNAILYSRILENLIQTFEFNWPVCNNVLDESVKNLISIDGATVQLLHDALLILTENIKNEENLQRAENLVLMLEHLIKSEALFSAIIKSARGSYSNDIEKSADQEIWRNVIQTIISLPNRIANKMQKKFPKSFQPTNFGNILNFHLAKAVEFLGESLSFCKIVPDTKILSILFSKILLNYPKTSEDLVKTLIDWFCESKIGVRTIFQTILSNLEPSKIENMAVTILESCYTVQQVLNTLGDVIYKNHHWTYTFTTKIPLMSIHDNEKLIKNLVFYLCNMQNQENRILVNLVTKLLYIWGDQSALNHTTIDQHLYITKLIICSVKIMNSDLKSSEKKDLQELLLSGVSVHLGSNDEEVRALGMVTGESLTRLLINAGDQLVFNYDAFSKKVQDLVRHLVSLEIKQEVSNEHKHADTALTNSEDNKLYQLAMKGGVVKTEDEAMPVEPACKRTYLETNAGPEIGKNTSQSADDANEIDSDDDLVPYDLSNDVNTGSKLKPFYLRDLRDKLVDSDKQSNFEVFEESLKASEDLILSQLPKDDVSFAIELLDLFLNLQENYSVHDFETLVFNACVAILLVYPKECAEHLCKEFNSELAKYSVQHRLFILHVLAESAKKLSKIQISEVPPKNDGDISRKPLKAPQKLNLLVETGRGKKYETFFDNDFDAFENTKSEVDWESVIQKRIADKTKRFVHETKVAHATANKFGNVAGSFFYLLLFNFNKRSFMYDMPKQFEDNQNLLLKNYLETIATIIICAQNCLIVPKMAREALELVWYLRYHQDAKIRLATIKIVTSVLIAIPEFTLRTDLFNVLIEIQCWLADISANSLKADPNADCRHLGKYALHLINTLLQKD